MNQYTIHIILSMIWKKMNLSNETNDVLKVKWEKIEKEIHKYIKQKEIWNLSCFYVQFNSRLKLS